MLDFDAIVSRGGIIKPVASGVYMITEEMLADMKSGKYGGKHQCSVGCKINFSIAQELGIPSLTVDPPAINELNKIATYSGNLQIWRRGSFHVLNQKAIARRLARDLGKNYEEMQAVIAHLGTGISIGAHYLRRVVDKG